MSSRPLLVLSLEAFSPAALSCYGSSWNETPALDAIAARSCVYDRWIVRQDDPVEPLRGLIATSEQWLSDFSKRGPTTLITDVGEVARLASQEGAFTTFDRVVEVPLPTARQVHTEVDQTHVARLIAEAIDRDQSQPPGWSLIWIHSATLSKVWDAPRSLFPIDEIELAEEEIHGTKPSFPAMIDDARVPRILPTTTRDGQDWWQALGYAGTDSRDHPDFVNAWMRTYGCQIRLIDFLIEVLLAALGDRDPRVLITGTSGFQLGQSGVIGHQLGPLRSPQIHVPMMISDLPAVRMPGVSCDDLLGTILKSLAINDLSIFGPQVWAKDEIEQLKIETKSARARLAMTTPSWFYVQEHDESEHLFFKPDDINDGNDVASLRPDITAKLREKRDWR